jgi:tRNA A-37 threonylcarbamoyl transferase component Bud32
MMNSRYQVMGSIAEGGYGAVLRAWDSQLGREVAIKRVRKGAHGEAADPAAFDKLLQEARTLSALQHPNVVTVFDVGVDDDGAFIVMEFLKGETLETLVTRGAFTQQDFETLVHQVLEGMIAAHEAGLVHLDLKPENLMVTWLPSGSFQVKILDFGLAISALHPVAQDADVEGGILGSIYFMAPEQFERGAVDARTDLYALGCLFYYALTQQYPFQGELGAQVMTSHLYHRVVPLSQLRPDLPAFIPTWVDWLQSRLPEQRPASVAEALKAFREQTVPPVFSEPDSSGPSRQVTSKTLMKEQVRRPMNAGTPLTRDLMPKGLLGETGHLKAKAGPGTPALKRTVASVGRTDSAGGSKAIWKWSRYTLPALALLTMLAGTGLWLRKRNLAVRMQRFVALAQDEAPTATASDVRLLLAYAEDPETSAAACGTLARVRSDAELDALVLQAVKSAKGQVARVNLLNVVAIREIPGGLEVARRLLDDADVEVQKAAWGVVGVMGGPELVPSLVERCERVPEALESFAEAALVGMVRRAENTEEAVVPVTTAYQSGLGPERYRALLVRVLGQVGGKGALAQVGRALEKGSIEIRKAAISALALWPTSEPLDLLASKFEGEEDPAVRVLMLMAAGQLTAQPGAMPQEDVFEIAKRLHAAAKDRREKDQALNVMSRVEARQTIGFLTSLAELEPGQAGRIHVVIDRLRTRLGKVVSADGAKMTLVADQAEFNESTTLMRVNGVLVNWESAADWASWLVDVPKAGSYRLQVSQASATDSHGTYEIQFGAHRLAAQTVPTGGTEVFKAFELGQVEVAKPGLYRLTLRTRQMPPGGRGSVFQLKAITLMVE